MVVTRLLSETGCFDTFLSWTGQLHKEDFVKGPRPEHNVRALGGRVDLRWEYNFLFPDLNQELPVGGTVQKRRRTRMASTFGWAEPRVNLYIRLTISPRCSLNWAGSAVVAVDHLSQQG
jgi:hypothetical protein